MPNKIRDQCETKQPSCAEIIQSAVKSRLVLTFKGPPSCAKIILQIRPFGQAQPFCAVSHVVTQNVMLEYIETTLL